MASVTSYTTKTGDTMWQVRYYTPDRTKKTKAGFRLKRDANAFAATTETAKLHGNYVDSSDGRVTVGELGEAWLARQTLKPSALQPLVISWRLYVAPRWGTTRIGDILHTDVQAWVAGMKLASKPGQAASASVAIRALSILRGILDDRVKDKRGLSSNPCTGIKMPVKAKKQHQGLTHEQVWAFAEAAGKNQALILFLAYSGVRWGEATALRIRNVDLLRRRVHVVEGASRIGAQFHLGTTKSGRDRMVPLPAEIIPYLARQCEGKGLDDLMFPAPRGGYLKAPNGTRGWFERARIKAGLPRVTPHDMRATAASLAVRAGGSVKLVQVIVGHANASMTLDDYGYLFTDELDSVSDGLSRGMATAGVGQPGQPRNLGQFSVSSTA